MKIQLDTGAKTIKLDENVKITAFINLLKKILPNNEWKEYTLETNTQITYWSNPIVIKEYPRYPYRYDWTITTGSTIGKYNADYKVTAGGNNSIYNLEVSNKLL